MSKSVVTYICNGRLGNNIIQYLAAKLFAKQINGLLLPPPANGKQPYFLSDAEFASFMLPSPKEYEKYHDKQTEKEGASAEGLTRASARVGKTWFPHGKCICLNEYYQRADIFQNYQSFILESLTDTVVFNQQMRFCDLFQDIEVPSEDTVVVHLRLDDFNFQGSSNVVDPQFFITQIKESNCKHVILVVDKLKYQGEINYINKIRAETQGVTYHMQQKSVLEDWNLLRVAPYVISSNSSFAWTACFIGKCQSQKKRVVYPMTYFYGHQDFACRDWEGWSNVDAKKVDFMK
jgi:hypothetical protein